MRPEFQAPRGTQDILPERSLLFNRIAHVAENHFRRAAFGRIETPAFEHTELFVRSVGPGTDIVEKEMFTFKDPGERSLTLRPEGTAGVCRAYLEHGMSHRPQPVKLWYLGPYFRRERPQAGRYRQFNQIGAEVIGAASPRVDAEVITLLDRILKKLRVPGVDLRISSLGSREARTAYRARLQQHLRSRMSELPPEIQRRIPTNPLRAFDSYHPQAREVLGDAPKLLDAISSDDAEHFDAVCSLLAEASVEFRIDPTLVRGLDYYTRTVFEFTSDHLGAQSAIAGGGRYDDLISMLGGPSTPAIGWAAGVERIGLALGNKAYPARLNAFVVAPDDLSEVAVRVVSQLRDASISADFDLLGRSENAQLKHALRAGAQWAVLVLSPEAAELRNLRSGERWSTELPELPEQLKWARRHPRRTPTEVDS